jgi:uncharacterized membrane protein YbjE (DUF340 family)
LAFEFEKGCGTGKIRSKRKQYDEENTMLKKIGLVVLGLIIGFVLGVFLSMAYDGHTLATGMVFFQEKELVDMGQAAEDAYYNEPNEVAVWALTRYIKEFNKLEKERCSAKVKKPYFMLAPHLDLFLAHARLGKIYKQMGKAEESKYHFEQAIIYKECPDFTEKDCIKFLDEMDKLHSKNLE